MDGINTDTNSLICKIIVEDGFPVPWEAKRLPYKTSVTNAMQKRRCLTHLRFLIYLFIFRFCIICRIESRSLKASGRLVTSRKSAEGW